MPTWLIASLIVAGVALLIVIVLLVMGKLKIVDIELGWPPKIKLAPSSASSSVSASERDAFLAERDGRIGNVQVDGAAPSTEAIARDRGQIGDISIKRPPK